MPITTTPLYASLLALIFVALSVRTLLLRRRFQVAIGGGDNVILERAIRVHGNFAEYAPLTVTLILLVELVTGQSWIVHVLGMLLVAGRLSHAFGVRKPNEDFRFRVAGMAMTFTSLIASAVVLFWSYVSAL